MTVALLWVGGYEQALDGVFRDTKKAKDHINAECHLQGWPSPFWAGDSCYTRWQDGADWRIKYWTIQEVEVH